MRSGDSGHLGLDIGEYGGCRHGGRHPPYLLPKTPTLSSLAVFQSTSTSASEPINGGSISLPLSGISREDCFERLDV